jgi:hypothetical protein
VKLCGLIDYLAQFLRGEPLIAFARRQMEEVHEKITKRRLKISCALSDIGI